MFSRSIRNVKFINESLYVQHALSRYVNNGRLFDIFKLTFTSASELAPCLGLVEHHLHHIIFASCIHIFSAKLSICSQTFINLKHIQELKISYEFDVRFHTKVPPQSQSQKEEWPARQAQQNRLPPPSPPPAQGLDRHSQTCNKAE